MLCETQRVKLNGYEPTLRKMLPETRVASLGVGFRNMLIDGHRGRVSHALNSVLRFLKSFCCFCVQHPA